MLNLKKSKNDDYSYYFYKTNLNLFSNYYDKVNNFLLKNIDNCDHLYLIHPFNVFNLHLLTLNSLYLYEKQIQNNNKKIIILNSSDNINFFNCDIYNNIDKINISYLYHYNDYFDDNYNLLITNINQLYNFLIQGQYKTAFNNNNEYIFILDLSIPYYETNENNIFNFFKQHNISYKLLIYSNYFNNNYIKFIQNDKQNIIINKYFDNKSLNRVIFFDDKSILRINKFDYFNFLLQNYNISNCLIYVNKDDYSKLYYFLKDNDIEPYNLSLQPFNTCNPNLNNRFYVIHDIHDFTSNLYFFEKGIIYSNVECILKHKDFLFHVNEEKKRYLFI